MNFVLLLGRFFYSIIFIMSSFGHFTKPAADYAASHGVFMPGLLVPISGAIAFLGGLSILLGIIFCVAATARSLGLLLSVPLITVIGAAIWLLVHLGLIDLSDGTQRILTFETALIVLLGTGVSFSLIRYRLSGQLDSRTLV